MENTKPQKQTQEQAHRMGGAFTGGMSLIFDYPATVVTTALFGMPSPFFSLTGYISTMVRGSEEISSRNSKICSRAYLAVNLSGWGLYGISRLEQYISQHNETFRAFCQALDLVKF